MNASTMIGMVVSCLLLASVLLFTAETPESFLNLPGLAIVLTGTLAATFISYPLREVVRVIRLVGIVFRRENTYTHDDIKELVDISRLWFKGDVRAVEKALEGTHNPFLRTGVQLVIANTKEAEILDLLRWRITRLKARERAEAQIFRTMAAYAPAFGMIGTLVGLVNMLEVMDTGDLASIGPRMAVALLTTFYGILLANLIFKPIAVKLERRTEERLIAMNMVLEGISLISKRRLPSFIEETLNSFMANHNDEIRGPIPTESDSIINARVQAHE
ncbi:MotA/TolQ/ExbB proton channel family protein [Halomonas sp. McH1-25]|uniref:motility protein A n=1 Tax=unclassified Halomonas TaxID=2609666 RepID=UPI001EF67D1A|nr:MULTISPECIES: MotA/TolQ/ExbB proton channel family protein [unclassified Halomonas]MCG7601966.1 MotA/TolQ/ExbB proton channel family protein [Halomonas sp. McH1-25]MCP1341593.1 MotA/TolQ/ExbB proton channel family protein [Halomonas sp. FL8]MCP1360239.1 MotA/TolQ/ExbB proton channel family protein [Halomonas sp. BBD45]MCP1366613.1 MotA/TolQ/ExbB proton channel family protein [Halomonas sp. BBD48]